MFQLYLNTGARFEKVNSRNFYYTNRRGTARKFRAKYPELEEAKKAAEWAKLVFKSQILILDEHFNVVHFTVESNG